MLPVLRSKKVLLIPIVCVAALIIMLLLWLLAPRTPIIVALSATGTDALPESITGVTLAHLTLIDSSGDTVRIGRNHTLSRENLFAFREQYSVPAGNYTALEMEFLLEGTNPTLLLGIPKGSVLHAPIQLAATEENVGALLLVVDINRSVVRRENKAVFLPVVRIETRKGVLPSQTGSATVEGGVIQTNATFGSTENGVLKQNYVAR